MTGGDATGDDTPPARVSAGMPAPGFDLAGTGGRRYRLADAAGGPLVLLFYPADGSPVCTAQLRSYSEDLDRFTRLGSPVWALSPQDVASHERFAADKGLGVPLLADVGAQVGRAYGVLGPLGFYRRSVFVVDATGTVRFARRSLSSLTFLPAGRVLEAVQAASA
ncbi:MAG TPA: peroxiredoxin [Acidimicrobiales bacterium]|nr:peroxiredoxin [Acidimicrobiales bacterium]